MNSKSLVHRVESLDALRGVAAFVVVIYHIIDRLPYPYANIVATPWQVVNGDPGWIEQLRLTANWTLLRLVWAGPEAVFLFFVLSGYVLALPILQGKGLPWWDYVRKRACRLYLPFLTATILALVVRAAVLHIAPHPFPRSMVWDQPVTMSVLVDHVLFLGGSISFNLDPPLWSLVHEMRISIYFPLLMLVVMRLPALLSVMIAAAVTLLEFHYMRDSGFGTLLQQALSSLADTMGYTYFFVIGILTARYRSSISSLFTASRGATQWILFAASLILLNAQGSLGPEIGGHVSLTMVIEGVGAAGLIALAASPTFLKRILHWQPFVWLGRVSYSLYLTHCIVIYAMWVTLGPVWGCLVGFVASFPVAALFYRLVELPTINLGRRYFGRSAQYSVPHLL